MSIKNEVINDFWMKHEPLKNNDLHVNIYSSIRKNTLSEIYFTYISYVSNSLSMFMTSLFYLTLSLHFFIDFFICLYKNSSVKYTPPLFISFLLRIHPDLTTPFGGETSLTNLVLNVFYFFLFRL